MSEPLSIIKSEEPDLSANAADRAALWSKVLLNCVPVVGSSLAEVFGSIIPNQKIDRVSAFVLVLNDRLKYVEEDVLSLQIRTERFADLLEEGFIQASKATSDERRQYIANLLKKALTDEQLSFIEQKKLMFLLNESNDVEIIMLKSYVLLPDARRDFASRYPEVFKPIHSSLGAPQENVDKAALRDSYRNRLSELGLITPVFKSVKRGELPEFDERTGRMKATSYKLTALGRLLLRYIEDN